MTRNRGPIAVLWSPFRCGRAAQGRPVERRAPHLRSRAERSRAPVRTAGSPGIARCPAPRSSGRAADLDRPGPGRRRLDARRLTIRRRPRADHPRPTGLHPPAPPIQGRRNPPLHNHHHPRRSRRSRNFVHPLMRKSQPFTRVRACHAALSQVSDEWQWSLTDPDKGVVEVAAVLSDQDAVHVAFRATSHRSAG